METFNSTLEAVSGMEFVGARWWKFDFHNHTPASLDYGRADPNLRNTMEPRAWLLQYVERGIECVAVTDHNSGDWIDRLKESAAQLRKEGVVIHVFPGVEISANSNIHVLAIFDEQATTQTITSLVGGCGYRGTHGSTDAVADKSAEQVIDEILKFGGLAIMAHIDLPAGMCQTSPQTMAQICKKASAVEVVFPNGKPPQTYREELRSYRALATGLPEVIGSDSHHPDEVGRAFTWVKMDAPTIDGLRLALVDGACSVQRSDEFSVDPNIASEMLITGLRVSEAKYCGRGKPFEISFNPWLNSIIGGRGSGKSSVLEFLRIATGRGKDLEGLPQGNEVRDSFERFVRKSVGRDSDGVMLEQTAIEVTLKKQGAYYKLSWEYAEQDVKIRRFVSGEWVLEGGDVLSRFPLKIFSQKQIFNYAKNPNALLGLIDSSDPQAYTAWQMKWEDTRNKYLRLAAQRRELEAKLLNRNALDGQLLDINQKIELIEKSGHAQVLSEYQAAVSRSESLNAILDGSRDYFSSIRSVVEERGLGGMAPQGFYPWDVPENEVLGRLAELHQNLSSVRDNVLGWINSAEASIREFEVWLSTSSFVAGRGVAVSNYEKLVSAFQEKGLSNPNEYQELIGTRGVLLQNIADLESLQVQIDRLKAEGDSAYGELNALRKELSSRRQAFVDRYINVNPVLRLEVEPIADIDGLDAGFRSVIQRQGGTFSSDIYDSDKNSGILFALNEAIVLCGEGASESGLDAVFDQLHKFKVDFFNFRSGAVMGVSLGKKFSDYLSNLKYEDFDQLVAWFPDDRLNVKYFDGKRMKDIAQGSAGQKAATVLSFLLSYGEEPLVLDQPEDDLDNGLISSLIVERLQKNKAGRQIIVVTHNPNIVVNGDSEYVIALQDHGRIEVTASGGLQDSIVRKEVCEIMEGGRAALQQRYRRMMNV